jgi:putative ABC transport system permease protein
MFLVRVARNVRLGVKTLLIHKLRSLLTMLGVVFGVGSVIAMLAVGQGASEEALRRIELLGSNNIIIESRKPAESQFSNQRMSIYGLLYDDADRIASSFGAVDSVVPAKMLQREGRYRTRVADLRVVGTTPEWFDLVRRDVIAGRALHDIDMTSGSSVVVLTQFGRDKLLAGEEIIGSTISIAGAPYEVVGIVRAAGENDSSGNTPDRSADAYVPISLARDRFGDINVQRSSGSFMRELVELHTILVGVRSTEEVEATARGVEHMLERFHPVQDYRVQVPLQLIREAEETQRQWNLVLGSIAGISLLVGGIGIMNIMLASVTERTREIGIRRAIGARKPQIVGQFLVETVVLSTVGGIIGIGLGYAIPWLIEQQVEGMPTSVPTWSIGLAAGISVTVGVVFGIYPAARAANLDPIDALRHE